MAVMVLLRVRHETVYRYRQPVRFGDHRIMCRPRESHDLRLLESSITLSPPAHLRWLHDPFGNSVLVAQFPEGCDELRIESSFLAEHTPVDPEVALIEPYARHLPFSYDAVEMPDLSRCAERHYPDSARRLDAWVRDLRTTTPSDDAFDTLLAMTRAIKDHFAYVARNDEGTQRPSETLDRRSGSCRDFALLMMEAARSLGLAARFVSGYLYDETRLSGSAEGAAASATLDGRSTHAWLQVYLPGAGWLAFDPTNASAGERNLIPVAVVRDPAQAVPIGGSFWGYPGDFLGMSVDVSITAERAGPSRP